MTSSPRADVDSSVRTRIRQQEVVAELGQRALETDDLDALMHDAAAAVAETLDNEYAKVLELLPDGDDVFLRQGVGWRDGLVGNATVPTDRDSQAGYTLLSEEPIIVDDLRTEDRFSGPELLTSHDVVSGISVVIGSVENPWGVLGTHTTERREFTQHDATFVQSVANVLASAIEETKTKQQLRERETELEEVYGRVVDGFIALGDDWEFTHVNERAEELLGVGRDELLGTTIWDAFPELVGTEFEERYREAMATQEPVSVEARYEPANMWFEERVHPSDTGLSIYFRDVTDQKQLENELETTFDRITDSFIGLDRDWEITYVNDRGSEILDPEDRGLVGKNFWDPFEPALGTTFEDEYREAMETQEPTSFEEYYPPLDVWFEVHAYPSDSGLSIYFRDATERKEREQELELFRTLLDHSTDSVLVIDPDTGQYIDANETACRQRGYSRAELLQLSVLDIETEIPDQEAWQSFVNDLKLEETVTFDGTHRRKDGTTFPVEVNVSHVELEQEYVLAVARDVTARKRREEDLRETKRRLELATKAASVGLWTWDIRENVVTTDDYLAETYGVDPEEAAAGAPMEQFYEPIHEEDTERTWEQLERAVEETGELEAEYRVRDADGNVKWVVARGKVIDDEDGDPVRMHGAITDITERKQREREFETFFEVLPVGVVVAEADGEIVEANDTAHSIWGGDVFDAPSVEEYERYPVRWADSGEPVPPEEMTLARVIDGEEVTEPDIVEIETVDGERRIVELQGMPIRNETGDVIRGVVTVSDITERKNAQRQLAESERHYRTLAEHFPNGVVGVYDDDLRYSLAAGELIGDPAPSAEEVEGTRMPDLYPDDAVADLEPLFRAAIEDGETESTRTTVVGRRWQVWATPLRDADGEIFAGLSFAQDITEQIEREEQLEDLVEKLEESNERLEQFAYAASHDLQEPLRMVSSYLQLLESRYGDELDDDAEEFLEFAVDGADRMREMIDGLLEYSRVDTQGEPLEPIDLNRVFENALDNLQVKIEESDAEIAAESLPRVQGDASQLHQVFQNLLSNAIEYSGDEPPQISVESERRGQKWLISVRDDGIGIDSDDQERIFEVFQRLHSRDEHSGTGIGLALCQRIVERHGGRIRVDSDPGEGTTFSFTLPAAAE